MIGGPRGGEPEKEKQRRRLLLLLLLLLLIPAALGGAFAADLLRGAPAVCSQSTPSVSPDATPAPSPSAIQAVGGVEATQIPTPTPVPTPEPSPVGSGDGGAQVGDADFRISGDVGGLVPGAATAIRLTLTNSNSVPIYITSLTVSISADSTPPGCVSASNIQLTQSNVSGTDPIVVPARGSVTLTSAPRAPRIVLVDLPGVNQNVCKNKSFGLTYSGSARL